MSLITYPGVCSCYVVAKHDRENTEALLESAQLEIQLGEHRKAADVLKWILDSDNANSNSGLYMSVTKELAKVCLLID